MMTKRQIGKIRAGILLTLLCLLLCGRVAMAAGTVHGSVVKAAGGESPVAGAVVTAYQEGRAVSEAVTDSRGLYTLNLPAGSYKLHAYAENYLDFIAYVTVEDGETLNNDTFRMIDADWTAAGVGKGTVTDAVTGEPLSGVKLTVYCGWGIEEQGDKMGEVTTGGNGTYNTGDLPLCNYTMFAEKEGYIPTTFNIIVKQGTTADQNGVMSPILPEGEYRIVLRWGDEPKDLDSHTAFFVDGSRKEVYFPNEYKRYPASGEPICILDIDDTDGFGPETTTLKADPDQIYYYYVHDYSNGNKPDNAQLDISSATVDVYIGTRRYTYNVPTNLGKYVYWNVFAIRNGQIIPRNTLTVKPEVDYAD